MTCLLQNKHSADAREHDVAAGGVRFVALVELDMRHSVTGEQVWSGSMQRVHTVYEGSYMHDEPARDAMYDAFMNLFADYPDRRLERE